MTRIELTFKHLKCSYGSVSNGTEAACHAAIVLESKSRQKAINDANRVIIRISQSMYVGGRESRRRLTRKRNLGEDDFRALNAVFNGIILKLPDQTLEKNVAFTLRFTIKTLLKNW